MAWIKIYNNLPNNPKTYSASELLKIDRVQVVGHLVMLWTRVSLAAEDGDLTKWGVKGIAEEAGWKGDPEEFVEALIHSGFIDLTGTKRKRYYYVHNWIEYVLPYLKSKYHTRNPKKLAKLQATLEARYTLRVKPLDHLLPEHKPKAVDAEFKVVEEPKKRHATKVKETREKINAEKVKHLDCVYLTNDQLTKLRLLYNVNFGKQIDGNGDERAQIAIEKLNNTIMAKMDGPYDPRKDPYKSHYHVLRGWVKEWLYEQEKKGLLQFSKKQPMKKGGDNNTPVYCDMCDQWLPNHETWRTHPCQTNLKPADDVSTAKEGIDFLLNRMKMPPPPTEPKK